LYLFVLFIIAGVTLKFSDFFGEKNYFVSSIIFAGLSAITFGWLITIDEYSSAIILGIIVGVILSGKVDKLNLIFGLITSLFVSVLIGFKRPQLGILMYVSVFSFIDEIGHESFKTNKRFFKTFFRFRFTLKLVMIILGISSLIPIIYSISFLCFDLVYDSTDWILNKIYLRKK
jgi:hypothetical protein